MPFNNLVQPNATCVNLMQTYFTEADFFFASAVQIRSTFLHGEIQLSRKDICLFIYVYLKPVNNSDHAVQMVE
jgi:hypothetical protein